MFNIGAGEMMFILVAALLILGPQRLPELARTIGKFVREFRRQTGDVRNVVEREFYAMDQEFQREPPRRPMPTPAAPPPPLEPMMVALPPPAETLEPVPHLPGAPEPQPAPLDPSFARTQELAPLAPEGASSEAGLPQLASLPGTVARNAPKEG